MEKKRFKLKPANIFVFVNILVILGICCFYGYRLVYYYKLEHPKTVKNKTFSEILTTDANLVYEGDGLYKNEDEYLFRGKEVNNYVYYSGRLWRIVKVNKNNSIKLVTADLDTSLVWGLDNNYEESYVKDWLIGDNNRFYNSLNQPDRYLQNDTYCIDKINEENITKCEETINSFVGLISYNEYSMAGLDESYLNIGKYFWTINGTLEDDAWHVTVDGKMGKKSHTIDDYNAYGVRPTVTLKAGTVLSGGKGTKDNPYTFEAENGKQITSKVVGEYITYSGLNWRIIEKTDIGVKVALDGFIKNEDGEDVEQYFSKSSNKYHAKNTNMGYYLNTKFYETLENKDYIVSTKWGTGQYNNYVDYDFTNVTYSSAEAYIGLLSIGDSFINDYENYFLITGRSSIAGTIHKVGVDGALYDERVSSGTKVRPALYLKNDLTIKSGKGTKDSPYVIG